MNLAFDGVVLIGVNWTREVDADGRERSNYLTATEYHNLLGRAGRPTESTGRKNCFAIVCLKPDQLDDTQLVDRYYRGEPLNPRVVDRVSGLFLKKDFDALALEGVMRDMGKVSHESFRAVMDALRHIAGKNKQYNAAEDLQLLFRHTVYWGACGKEDQGSVRALTRKVLDLSGEAGLVEVRPGANPTYVIGTGAEALIDTGTRWQAVQPMKLWLQALKERYSKGYLDPAELLLPALVATPELWNLARLFCWEHGEKREPSPDAVRANEDAAWAVLSEELTRHLSINDPDDLRARLVALLSDVDCTTDQPRFRGAILFRLTSAFLRWLRGASVEEIVVLSLRRVPEGLALGGALKSEANHFKPRYWERARWLSVMCLRYFGKLHSLLPAHARELPRLALRLSTGLRAAGLPFLVERGEELSRQEIRAVLDKGITPRKVVCHTNPGMLLTQEELPEEVKSRAVSIVDGVFRYFRYEMTALQNRLEEHALQENDVAAARTWVECSRPVFDILDARGPGIGGGINSAGTNVVFAAALYSMLSGSVSSGLRAILQSDKCSIRVGPDESQFMLTVPTSVTASQGGGNDTTVIMVGHPWPMNDPDPNGSVVLTSWTAAVLCYLLRRELVRPRDVREWAIGSKGLRSLKDLIVELDPPRLPGDIREAMLTFEEAGVDA